MAGKEFCMAVGAILSGRSGLAKGVFSLWLATGGIAMAQAFAPSDMALPDIVKVYTHGEGDYGLLGPDGSITGPGVDYLACAMGQMDQPYHLGVASMARSVTMEENGQMDMWFPTYDTGADTLADRLVGPIGEMAIHWFTLADAALDPTTSDFRARARVTAFPGSLPDRTLRAEGYHVASGPDDANRMLLMLVEGRVDAILAADFRNTLKPGASQWLDRLRVTEFRRYPMMFELIPAFVRRYPQFQTHMQLAFNECRLRGMD